MAAASLPVPDPDVAPGGMWGALLTGLGAALGGLGVWLKSRTAAKKQAERVESSGGAQLDRIEAALEILTKTLVIPTEDGGRIATSRRLADTILVQIGSRLDKIEAQLGKRPGNSEKLDDLRRNVEGLRRDIGSLTEAVLSSVEIQRASARRKE